MSHFSVLVIGEDVEGQLAPYHEFECTGQDDQFVLDPEYVRYGVAVIRAWQRRHRRALLRKRVRPDELRLPPRLLAEEAEG